MGMINASIRAVAQNVLVGAGLGVFLALSVIVGNTIVFDWLVRSAAPGISVLATIGVFAFLMAAGYSITGFIFAAIEKRQL